MNSQFGRRSDPSNLGVGTWNPLATSVEGASAGADPGAHAAILDPGRHLSRPERQAALLLCAAIAGSAFLPKKLPLNFAIGDMFLVAIGIGGMLVLMQGGGGPFRKAFTTSAPLLWLLGVASLISLLGVGLPAWAIDHGLRDIGSLASFSIFGAYLWKARRAAMFGMWAFAVVGILVTVSILLAGTQDRQEGLVFRNPNYAAHFMACAIIVTFYLPIGRLAKTLGIVAMAAAVLRTGSFGAIVMIITVAMLIPYRSLRALGPGSRSVARVLLLVVAFGGLYVVGTSVAESDLDFGYGTNASRLDRSSSTRLELWSSSLVLLGAHPAGVGPHGLVHREDLGHREPGESHNDYVAFLAETGPLGLVAFLGIGFVVFQQGMPGGPVRTLLFGLTASSVGREIVNFRHIWIALIVLVLFEAGPWGRTRSQTASDWGAGLSRRFERSV